MWPCALEGLVLVLPKALWNDEVLDGLGKIHAFARIEDLAGHPVS